MNKVQKLEWSTIKQLKIRLPSDPALLLLGIYPKDLKARS